MPPATDTGGMISILRLLLGFAALVVYVLLSSQTTVSPPGSFVGFQVPSIASARAIAMHPRT